MKAIFAAFLLTVSIVAHSQQLPYNTVDCDNANGNPKLCTVEADEKAKTLPDCDKVPFQTFHGHCMFYRIDSKHSWHFERKWIHITPQDAYLGYGGWAMAYSKVLDACRSQSTVWCNEHVKGSDVDMGMYAVPDTPIVEWEK